MKKYRIGKIVKTHGLKGEMKVYSFTDYPERFAEIDYLYMHESDKKYFIENIKYQKNMAILKIKGIDTIEEAENLIDTTLYIDQANLRELDEDEYMIADLVGMDVVLTTGETIGKVTDVLQYTANDIYVVHSESGDEYLIPAVKEFVPEINMSTKTITVNPVEGLL